MSGVRHLTVSEDDDGQRLDRWLKRHVPEIPYILLQKLLRQGQMRVDGKRAKPEMRLKAGQDIRIPPVKERGRPDGKPALSHEETAFIRSLVVYDDGEVLALNKPAGLAVQGGTNTRRHIDGMLDALVNKKGVRPRLVHRLDKDTSGVLLLARSAETARKLGDLFKGREIKKIYWAICSPAPAQLEGTIKAPLVKAGGPDKEKMVVDEEEGKIAVTDFVVLERAMDSAAFVAFWPRTGRTHQIRVHAQLMGASILGDHKYKAVRNPESKKPEADLGALGLSRRLYLHARRLILPHPLRKGHVLDITAPLPPELAAGWKALGFDPSYKADPFEDAKP
ncbi:MAG: RluA family pseudouridine synthase [Alphaproteobacteria bacterium]|nr:RluA family pseudouridine synthase [Alphaproteobacteria bacterium]